MTILITCPGCQASLRVREEYAGKKMKCPKCGGPVPVPAARTTGQRGRPAQTRSAAEDEEEPMARGQAETIACPECGRDNPASARYCCHCRAELYEEEPVRGRGKFKPCPRCGAYGAKRVTWTPWGSFYGPALFTHVRCPECGYSYNGKTGGSNLLPAIVFVTIPAFLILILLGVIFFILWTRVINAPS